MNWSTHYPGFFESDGTPKEFKGLGDKEKGNEQMNVVESEKGKELMHKVEFADIGCGYGGLLG